MGYYSEWVVECESPKYKVDLKAAKHAQRKIKLENENRRLHDLVDRTAKNLDEILNPKNTSKRK